MKKEHLPSKICPTCKRPFVWRKKFVGREDHQAVSATELEGAFQDGLGGVHFLREGRPLGLLGRPWGLMHLDFAWWGRRSWHEVRAPSELARGVAVPQQVVLVGQS